MISFVVVSYNSAETLKSCLGSLAKQSDSEVILVDNASRDGSASIGHKLKGIRVIENTTNLGFNGGNQVGVQAAGGDIIVFFNPDAVAPPDFSQKLSALFTDKPSIDVIGCRIENSDGSLQRTCNRFPTFTSLLYENSAFSSLRPQHRAFRNYIYAGWDRRSEKSVDAVSGACLAVRTKVLDAIGGLDPRYFLFFEEFDLCRRVKMRGGSVLFTPEIVVRHIGGTSTKKEQSDFIDQTYLKSRNYYVIKFHGRLFLSALQITSFCCNKIDGARRRLLR